MNLKKLNYKWLIKLLGLIILGFILYSQVSPEKLLTTFKDLNPYYLVLCFLFLIISSFFNPWRWSYILNQLSIDYPLRKSYKTYYSTMILGLITPGRIGEIASRAFILKNKNNRLDKSIVSIVLDKIFDLTLLLLVSCLGYILILDNFKQKIIGFSLFFLIIISFFLLKKDFIKNIFKKIITYFFPQKKMSFLNLLNKFSKESLLISFLLTCLAWSNIIIAMIFLAKAWQINGIPIVHFIFAMFVSRLISLIPISINGLGTREAALLYLFGSFGLISEKIIGFSLSITIMNIAYIFFANLISFTFKEPK